MVLLERLKQGKKGTEENGYVVQTILHVVRHLAKQNCAFRGHDGEDSSNRGNLPEELPFIDKPLKHWIETHPENVSYFSASIQNEMLAILGNKSLVSKYFSIQCDEVTSQKRAFMSEIVP